MTQLDMSEEITVLEIDQHGNKFGMMIPYFYFWISSNSQTLINLCIHGKTSTDTGFSSNCQI